MIIKLKPKSKKNANIEAIILTLTVFHSLEYPMSALISYLLGFQLTPLSSFIKPCDVPLGAYSFCTASSVFWVRGNQFIRIEEFRKDNNASPRPSIYNTAAKLDDYLAHQHEPSNNNTSVFSLSDSIRQSPIHRGQKFAMQLSQSSHLLEEKQAVSEDPRIVLPIGLSSDTGEFEFYAMSAGKTQVWIHAADPVTLRPRRATLEVEVAG